MKYREFTCIYCGAKSIDRSTSQSKKYCDITCQRAYLNQKKRKKLDVDCTCIHNRNVLCNLQKCSTCGWNPNVELKRKEAIGYG